MKYLITYSILQEIINLYNFLDNQLKCLKDLFINSIFN